ncbi:MAG: hypothetical protein L6R36_000012 [Xanthoria steineri]|nr:MAG: hypothetical protein L6R36_000012 [Xanthoria steineri]
MANGASLIIGLIFIVVISILAYFFSPKAIVFLAQWHPLIKPANANLRPQFVHS